MLLGGVGNMGPYHCSGEDQRSTRDIRDGIPIWYRTMPPWSFIPHQKEKDPGRQAKMGEKLDTLFMRRYFIYGLILSLISCSAITKGDTYI
jgi:hypothetical protein